MKIKSGTDLLSLIVFYSLLNIAHHHDGHGTYNPADPV